MTPATPVIRGHPEVVFAKDQAEYLPLPAIRDRYGVVTTRWHMTWPERLRALFRGDVYVQVMTFNQPLQPVKVSVKVPEVGPAVPTDERERSASREKL